MKDTPVREVWIDTVRGIAILLVVLGHIDMGSHPLGKWIYSFHIPLFFLLSGFLVAERYASYLKSRFHPFFGIKQSSIFTLTSHSALWL